ncbi:MULTISPECIES: hypothetical protein [Bacillus]|nr:hypothetical protein [Bacillus sonorensis]GIN68487.1 hypothetical protein J41TS2_39080 [Bacillus sonorensis]
MKDTLKIAINFIEVNRKELGDKKALDMLLKAIKKIAAEAAV